MQTQLERSTLVQLESRPVPGDEALSDGPPPREEPAMHGRVQRLHTSVEHLGKLRDVGDVAHGDLRLAQRARRAAGGDELPATLVQSAGELEKAGLVGDGKKGAGHR